MIDFTNALQYVEGVFEEIGSVSSALGLLVEEIPYLSFALGLSCFLAICTWLIKMAVHR